MHNGIHHVTAIGGPAERNRDFYTNVLGLRLVKRTVNFDDPGTYHLYYGDEIGQPGTILTFFPWEHVAPGRIGAGETMETSFRVPREALRYWAKRLGGQDGPVPPVEERFGAPVLRFTDPDGLGLALVGIDDAEREPFWKGGDNTAETAIRGFHGVTLLVSDPEPTADVLTGVLGFTRSALEGPVTRFTADGATGAMGGVVDLRAASGLPPGRMGGGSVHHVAFRAADDGSQAEMARKLHRDLGIPVTEQKDRNYFRSIYFREPGGVIFEIATDAPGFAVDEATEKLGTSLKLPSFLETKRARIEAALPELSA